MAAAIHPGLEVRDFDPFGGRSVVVRPARPDDLQAVGAMLSRLSAASRRLRFFSPVPRPTLRLVKPMVEADHVLHESIVALAGDTVIGVAEYFRRGPESDEAEVAVVVEDAYQREGVATFLFRSLARNAWRQGIRHFVAQTLPDNRAALELARSLSPAAHQVFEDGEVKLRIPLDVNAAPSRTPAPVG